MTHAETTNTFAMPSLGADMDEGSVIEWLVDVGDTVDRGQIVARVETEKSDIDIEIWQEGVVDEILVAPGRTVPVGATLMRLHSTSANDTDPVAPPPVPPSEPRRPEVSSPPSDSRLEPSSAPDASSSTQQSSHGVVWATPLARRLAGDRGIELSEVVGSGPRGAIRSVDLPGSAELAAGDADTAAANSEESVRPTRAERMRSRIAVRMAHSNSEIPHYRLERRIDLAPLLDHLARINADRPIGERIVPAAALVHAVAVTAKRHPELNGTWSDDRFHPGLGVNVSVAISLRGGGLVTPTIRDADGISLDDTMRLLREFTTAARSGTLRAEWTAVTSSITVTNLGDHGADLVHGLISPPEVALVGFGRIIERPWVVGGAVAVRPLVTATLAADHRATDGAIGSRFLATLADTLEHPESS